MILLKWYTTKLDRQSHLPFPQWQRFTFSIRSTSRPLVLERDFEKRCQFQKMSVSAPPYMACLTYPNYYFFPRCSLSFCFHSFLSTKSMVVCIPFLSSLLSLSYFIVFLFHSFSSSPIFLLFQFPSTPFRILIVVFLIFSLFILSSSSFFSSSTSLMPRMHLLDHSVIHVTFR